MSTKCPFSPGSLPQSEDSRSASSEDDSQASEDDCEALQTRSPILRRSVRQSQQISTNRYTTKSPSLESSTSSTSDEASQDDISIRLRSSSRQIQNRDRAHSQIRDYDSDDDEHVESKVRMKLGLREASFESLRMMGWEEIMACENHGMKTCWTHPVVKCDKTKGATHFPAPIHIPRFSGRGHIISPCRDCMDSSDRSRAETKCQASSEEDRWYWCSTSSVTYARILGDERQTCVLMEGAVDMCGLGEDCFDDAALDGMEGKHQPETWGDLVDGAHEEGEAVDNEGEDNGGGEEENQFMNPTAITRSEAMQSLRQARQARYARIDPWARPIISKIVLDTMNESRYWRRIAIDSSSDSDSDNRSGMERETVDNVESAHTTAHSSRLGGMRVSKRRRIIQSSTEQSECDSSPASTDTIGGAGPTLNTSAQHSKQIQGVYRKNQEHVVSPRACAQANEEGSSSKTANVASMYTSSPSLTATDQAENQCKAMGLVTPTQHDETAVLETQKSRAPLELPTVDTVVAAVLLSPRSATEVEDAVQLATGSASTANSHMSSSGHPSDPGSTAKQGTGSITTETSDAGDSSRLLGGPKTGEDDPEVHIGWFSRLITAKTATISSLRTQIEQLSQTNVGLVSEVERLRGEQAASESEKQDQRTGLESREREVDELQAEVRRLCEKEKAWKANRFWSGPAAPFNIPAESSERPSERPDQLLSTSSNTIVQDQQQSNSTACINGGVSLAAVKTELLERQNETYSAVEQVERLKAELESANRRLEEQGTMVRKKDDDLATCLKEKQRAMLKVAEVVMERDELRERLAHHSLM